MKQREAVPVINNGYMSCGYYFYPASFFRAFNILRCKLIKEPTIKKSIGKAKKDEKIMKKSRHDEKATEQ